MGYFQEADEFRAAKAVALTMNSSIGIGALKRLRTRGLMNSLKMTRMTIAMRDIHTVGTLAVCMRLKIS